MMCMRDPWHKENQSIDIYMVQSIIVPGVNYPEKRKLDADDVDLDAAVYEMTIKGKRVEVAVGQAKMTFIDQNVVYFPVYLIRGAKVVLQLGVFEIFSNKQMDVVDADGDADVSLLGEPLLYSYVTEEDLSADIDDAPEEEEPSEDVSSKPVEQEPHEEEEEDLSLDMGMSPLDNQDSAQDEKERLAYKKVKGEAWVATYMSNNNYAIVENEGGGDCLFAAIRDGLSRAGVKVSVDEMREKIAAEMTQAGFDQYKTLYEGISASLATSKAELKTLASEHRDAAKRARAAKERSVQLELLQKAKEIGEKHRAVKAEVAASTSMLQEFSFMKDVKDLEGLKELVKTCSFWGDTWAISTLERVLNVKLVLFSEEAYKDKDLDNVLQCGQLNDENKGDFKPSHYIMLNYLGYHYQLITYKGRGAFTFASLPWAVRSMIVSKCLERQAGPFSRIPEVRDFLEEINVVVPPDVPVETLTDLYDDSVVFQFYSKSGDAKPGKGSGERITADKVASFSDLAGIKDWRKMLSNFWTQEFELDGHKWKSVEHYYQASKFKKENPEFYKKFSLDHDPESKLANDPALAKAAGGKTGKFKKTDVRPKEVKVDPDFFSGRDKDEMEAAMMAKFSQNEDLKRMLLATKKAKLQHFSRGKPPVVFDNLMRVRSKLSR